MDVAEDPLLKRLAALGISLGPEIYHRRELDRWVPPDVSAKDRLVKGDHPYFTRCRATFERLRQSMLLTETSFANFTRLACGDLRLPVILLLNPTDTQNSWFERMVPMTPTLQYIDDVLLRPRMLDWDDVVILDLFPFLTNERLNREPERNKGDFARLAFDLTRDFLETFRPAVIVSCQCNREDSRTRAFECYEDTAAWSLGSSMRGAENGDVKIISFSGRDLHVVQCFHPSAILRRNTRYEQESRETIWQNVIHDVFAPYLPSFRRRSAPYDRDVERRSQTSQTSVVPAASQVSQTTRAPASLPLKEAAVDSLASLVQKLAVDSATQRNSQIPVKSAAAGAAASGKVSPASEVVVGIDLTPQTVAGPKTFTQVWVSTPQPHPDPFITHNSIPTSLTSDQTCLHRPLTNELTTRPATGPTSSHPTSNNLVLTSANLALSHLNSTDAISHSRILPSPARINSIITATHCTTPAPQATTPTTSIQAGTSASGLGPAPPPLATTSTPADALSMVLVNSTKNMSTMTKALEETGLEVEKSTRAQPGKFACPSTPTSSSTKSSDPSGTSSPSGSTHTLSIDDDANLNLFVNKPTDSLFDTLQGIRLQLRLMSLERDPAIAQRKRLGVNRMHLPPPLRREPFHFEPEDFSSTEWVMRADASSWEQRHKQEQETQKQAEEQREKLRAAGQVQEQAEPFVFRTPAAHARLAFSFSRPSNLKPIEEDEHTTFSAKTQFPVSHPDLGDDQCKRKKTVTSTPTKTAQAAAYDAFEQQTTTTSSTSPWTSARAPAMTSSTHPDDKTKQDNSTTTAPNKTAPKKDALSSLGPKDGDAPVRSQFFEKYKDHGLTDVQPSQNESNTKTDYKLSQDTMNTRAEGKPSQNNTITKAKDKPSQDETKPKPAKFELSFGLRIAPKPLKRVPVRVKLPPAADEPAAATASRAAPGQDALSDKDVQR